MTYDNFNEFLLLIKYKNSFIKHYMLNKEEQLKRRFFNCSSNIYINLL